MSTTTIIAIFFITWWIVLFAVLPWGVRSQHEGGEVSPGTDPGAPMAPHLGWKLVMTTLITCVVMAIFYLIYVYRLLTLDDLAPWLPV